jgi:hypothetical protein
MLRTFITEITVLLQGNLFTLKNLANSGPKPYFWEKSAKIGTLLLRIITKYYRYCGIFFIAEYYGKLRSVLPPLPWAASSGFQGARVFKRRRWIFQGGECNLKKWLYTIELWDFPTAFGSLDSWNLLAISSDGHMLSKLAHGSQEFLPF